jgi:hypothetical protein
MKHILTSDERTSIGETCNEIQKAIQAVYMPPLAILETLYSVLQTGTDFQCADSKWVSVEDIERWEVSVKKVLEEVKPYTQLSLPAPKIDEDVA